MASSGGNGVLTSWLNDVTEYSSLHGLVWIKRTDNPVVKWLIITISMLTILFLPICFIGTDN